MMSLRWPFFGICTALVLSTSTIADENPTFRFVRSIEAEQQTQEELFAVALDSDVYLETRDSFPDLRVLDAADRLVPFLIRRVSETRTQKVRKSWTASDPELQPLENNGLEIRIALKPDDPAPHGMRFVTPLQNFEQQVRVFATADGTESAIVDGALIFDYSQFMDVRRTEVILPATPARELRIVIDALTSDQESQLLELTRSIKDDSEESRTETTRIQRRPFRIDRIELWTEEAEQSHQANVLQTWPVTDLTVTQNPELQQTTAAFTSRREPLTELRIVTSSRNFSRHAIVRIPPRSGNGMDAMKRIAESTLSRFQLRNLQEEHLSVRLPETRHDYYEIVIDNGDSPELAIEGIESVGHQYEVVFLATPEARFRLVYGSETAEAPKHDTAALERALRSGIRPVATTMGSQSKLQKSSAARPADLKSLLNNPILLSVMIAALVIILGWGLYQASRRIDGNSPDDGA